MNRSALSRGLWIRGNGNKDKSGGGGPWGQLQPIGDENANPNVLRPMTTDNPFSVANRREQVGMSPSVPDCDVCGVVLDPLSKRCGMCKKHLCGSCKEDHGCLSCRLGSALVSQCESCGVRLSRGPKCERCDRRLCGDCLHTAIEQCEACNPPTLPPKPSQTQPHRSLDYRSSRCSYE